jgi:NTE family protein
MKYPFRNLIFEGGGVKGIGYVGALKALEDRKIVRKITRVGGTSAGAINAVLLALGFTLKETEEILFSLNFRNFMDDSWGVIRDTNRLISEFGFYKGDFFRDWMGRLIEKKTANENSTFNDLRNRKFKDLYLIGTNLSTGFSEVFSADHTPRTRVVDAARISMSLPLFFRAVRNFRNDVYVDGGVFNNYPIKLFDRKKYVTKTKLKSHAVETEYYKPINEKLRGKHPGSSQYLYNKETLGFRLDSAKEIAVFRDAAEPEHRKIEDFFDYAGALIHSVLNVQEDQHLHSDDWHRTIYINTLNVKTTDFDLPNEDKQNLIEQGKLGVDKYFEWYDKADPNDLPSNLPS